MTASPVAGLLFRPAAPADEPALLGLLEAAGLPSGDVGCGAQELLTAWDGPALVGAVGLERYDPDVLLRSLVVAQRWRGRGLGGDLCRRALARARALGLRGVYLLTTTAAPFFAARGFTPLERAAVPAAVRASGQFHGGCCASAACLGMILPPPARHLTAHDLPLRPDVPGSRFWAVALERAMLTYFELEPGARFGGHRHEAEQITLVLEGELRFELPDAVAVVGPGEVLAIPGNVWHAARAGAARCRAVDAWSPPRADLAGPR